MSSYAIVPVCNKGRLRICAKIQYARDETGADFRINLDNKVDKEFYSIVSGDASKYKYTILFTTKMTTVNLYCF